MKRGFATGIIVCAILSTGACSALGDMTCGDYGELSHEDRSSAVWSMIEDEGLSPGSNALGASSIQDDVSTFCGAGPDLAEMPATSHMNDRIYDVVDGASFTY